MREVARRAGVSTAGPYWHFSDRNALLAVIAGECATRWLEAMRAAVKDLRADETLRRLQATGIAHVRFAVENPAHFRVMEMPSIRALMPQDVPRRGRALFTDEEGRDSSRAQPEGLPAHRAAGSL